MTDIFRAKVADVQPQPVVELTGSEGKVEKFRTHGPSASST
jgi:acetolactate synthase small subunit